MIGPPLVTVAHSNKSITVKLQAPRSPYRRKRGSKIPMTNYYDLLFQVFIINNLLDEVRVYSDTNPLPLNSQKSVSAVLLLKQSSGIVRAAMTVQVFENKVGLFFRN